MKSPLRYPGGKTRAVKYILPYIPKDITELCSPFFGGGSVELAVVERGTMVYGYDVFQPLTNFWHHLLRTPMSLSILADSLRTSNGALRGLTRQDFLKLKQDLISKPCTSIDQAAKFYALNRSSFSGATLSGGYSKQAAYQRFTNSSILRLWVFEAYNLEVRKAGFKQSIQAHPDAFLYCDPPYLLENNNLYGKNGDTHAGFDHEGLFNLLNERKGWVLSYNNSPQIREMYKDYQIIEAEWAYGMRNVSTKTMGSSSEILVIG
jgi:DNA adenine methylase